MSIINDVETYLKTDATLVGLLPGGIYTATLTKEAMPAAFDANAELLPTLICKAEIETIVGVASELPISSGAPLNVRTPIALWFYQQRGYSAIDAAMARAMVLLHGSRLGGAGGVYTVVFAEELPPQQEDVTRRSFRMQRYYVTRQRT